MSVLTQPAWNLHAVRYNTYTIIAAADVLSYQGAILAYSFNAMIEQQYPIRVGFVPLCTTSADSREDARQPEPDALSPDFLSSRFSQHDVCVLTGDLKSRHDGKIGARFLTEVATAVVKKHQSQQMAAYQRQEAGADDEQEEQVVLSVGEALEIYATVTAEAAEGGRSLDNAAVQLLIERLLTCSVSMCFFFSFSLFLLSHRHNRRHFIITTIIRL